MNKNRRVLFSILIAFVMLAVAFLPTFTVHAEQIFPQASAVQWTNTYDGTYYDNINADKGTALRSQLVSLLNNSYRSATTYDSLKTQLNTTDKDPNTNSGILMFYTGLKKSSYSDKTLGESNREHVWPKIAGKAFPESTGPGCDIQHLRPCDSQLNSTRNSFGFAEVVTNTIAQQNGSTNYANLCYLGKAKSVVDGTNMSGTFFYPGEGYRGATARILMYMQVMWGDQYNLQLVLGHTDQNSPKKVGDFATLLKWHLEEPPTQAEILRNNEAYKIQGNRNPFIDHPEYAELIYCNDGKSYNSTLQKVVSLYGSYVTDGGTVTDHSVEDFRNAVNAVMSATTDNDKLVKINEALVHYNNLSAVNKQAVVSDYQVLQAQIQLLQSVDNFKSAVQSISDVTNQSDKYNKIVTAISCYNILSESEKQSLSSQYQALQQAITDYNNSVSVINTDTYNATNSSTFMLAKMYIVASIVTVVLQLNR